MKVEELIDALRQMPMEATVRVSVDVSKSEADYDRRAFGEEFVEVFCNGGRLGEVTMCFAGELNDDVS